MFKAKHELIVTPSGQAKLLLIALIFPMEGAGIC